LTTVLLESLPVVGGQIMAFYPESAIYDVPGFPQVLGRDLIARLEAQARQFPIVVRLGERVGSISRPGGSGPLRLLTLRTAGRAAPPEAILTDAVLLTPGIGSFAPQRLRDASIARFEGKGLGYFSSDPAALAGSRVLVVGGGERAVETALGLSGCASQVTLVHRRDRLAIDPDTRTRFEASSVRFLPFRELVALHGGERVEQAELEDRRDGSRETIDVDRVVACYGFSASAATLRDFGVALEGDAVRVDSRMSTNVDGVFAAGDGTTYPGKVRLLAADFGEACTAVNNIAERVIPGAALFPGYSSHRQGVARR
jgi:thioredoxin reductase (NADPH)